MDGTDMFYYHGYCALWINDRWLKVTPVFNAELCDRFGVKTQEFDGSADSLFQPYDRSNRQHMEYITDHETFDDLPFDELKVEMTRLYPGIVEQQQALRAGDFAAEASAENPVR